MCWPQKQTWRSKPIQSLLSMPKDGVKLFTSFVTLEVPLNVFLLSETGFGFASHAHSMISGMAKLIKAKGSLQ